MTPFAYDVVMDRSEVQGVLSRIDQQLAGLDGVDPGGGRAVEELLNLVERLVSGQQAIAQEVRRLLSIHKTIECPVAPLDLPPDAVRISRTGL